MHLLVFISSDFYLNILQIFCIIRFTNIYVFWNLSIIIFLELLSCQHKVTSEIYYLLSKTLALYIKYIALNIKFTNFHFLFFFFCFKEFRNYILGIIRAWSLMFPILILQYMQVCIYYLLFCETFFFCVFWAFDLMSYLPNSKHLFNYYLNKCHLAISDLVPFL